MTITAVVTGATGGIGKEIARGLVRQGATVVIGVRNPDKGEAVRAELARESGGGRVEVMPLDVSSMQSVRTLVVAVSRAHSVCQKALKPGVLIFRRFQAMGVRDIPTAISGFDLAE